MILKKRKLILFQSREFSDEIYNELTAHDWNVSIVNNLQQAVDLLNERVFNVGLCLLEGKCNTPECCVDKPYLISECIKGQQLTQTNQLFSLQ